MKKILFITLTAFLLLSCEESNISINQNYIGVWTNVNGNLTRTLEVETNGQCYYEEMTRTGNMSKYISFNGKFILQDSILRIGFKKLTINKEPTLSNSVWSLTMDNIEYTGK